MGAFLAELLFSLFVEIVGWILWIVCSLTAVVLVRIITLNFVGFDSWPPRHSRALVLSDDWSPLVGVLMWGSVIAAFIAVRLLSN